MTNIYFAYGSNLDEAQMKRRCPDSEKIGHGILGGYWLTFGGKSRTWGGAVGNVVTSEYGSVDGILYEVTKDDLLSLDEFEGHPTVYKRKKLEVAHVKKHGCAHKVIEFVDAWVYAKPKAGFVPTAPAPKYLAVLKKAYQKHGLPLGALREAVEIASDHRLLK